MRSGNMSNSKTRTTRTTRYFSSLDRIKETEAEVEAAAVLGVNPFLLLYFCLSSGGQLLQRSSKIYINSCYFFFLLFFWFIKIRFCLRGRNILSITSLCQYLGAAFAFALEQTVEELKSSQVFQVSQLVVGILTTRMCQHLSVNGDFQAMCLLFHQILLIFFGFSSHFYGQEVRLWGCRIGLSAIPRPTPNCC